MAENQEDKSLFKAIDFFCGHKNGKLIDGKVLQAMLV